MSSISREARWIADRCTNVETNAPLPEVSVVVATYNRPQFVAALLERLAALDTPPSFELVVVDDGSTPETWQQIAALVPGLPYPVLALRLRVNQGRSVARNTAIAYARGELIAITDDDCLPGAGWLRAGAQPFFSSAGVADSAHNAWSGKAAPAEREPLGIAQGITLPNPEDRAQLLSHFIEITKFDGTFSTCNVFYRRAAIEGVGGFDPSVTYWEDVDLGWRVRRAGWAATWAPAAVVYHRVLPLTLRQWLRWPLHFTDMPAKAARFPEYRAFLFLGLWVHWFHALFDLAVLGALLGAIVRRPFFALVIPYLVAFPLHHGLRGRWPLLKAALHLAWDTVSLVALVVGSVRHRSPVL